MIYRDLLYLFLVILQGLAKMIIGILFMVMLLMWDIDYQKMSYIQITLTLKSMIFVFQSIIISGMIKEVSLLTELMMYWIGWEIIYMLPPYYLCLLPISALGLRLLERVKIKNF